MTIPLLLCLAGAWIGFANPLLHFPPAALLYPAGLAFAAFQESSLGTGLRRGWILGSVASAACLYWVVIPVNTYGGLPLALSIPCPLLLGMYLGLYAGCFVMVLKWGQKRFHPVVLGILAGLTWFCLEYIRGRLFTGLPWLTLSQAFSPWPFAIQGARFIGAYGLSGLFCILSVWTVLGLKRLRLLVFPMILTVLIAAYGAWEMNRPIPRGDSLQVGIAQGSIEQDHKWEAAYQAQTVDTYLTLSSQMLARTDLDLLVWPETALPFYFQDPQELSRRVISFAGQNDVALLTGSPAYTVNPDGSYILYNRAFLLDRRGMRKGYYDKEHLVPFGEYVPFGRYLPFLNKLVAGVGDFAPGRQARPLALDGAALGMLICYEAIFPELAQQRVDSGANLLVNISNDAWFGASSAPWQHLHLAVLRAVEQNRWLVRSTNTGISTFVDPKGRVTATNTLFQPETLHAQVTLIERRTFFSTFHRPVTLLFFGLTLGLLLLGRFRPLKQHGMQAMVSK